jgi:uncharacterized phiE125 gp8 family phage protein
MAYVLFTPPAGEPLDLATARLHLRADPSALDDTLILAAISAARDAAENTTARQLCTATWNLVMDRFPHAGSISGGVGDYFPKNSIVLNKSPVQSVVEIRYLDMGGSWQVMPSTDYVVDTSTEPARITPVFGKIWPICMPQIASVIIQFIAGYGSPIYSGASITGWTGNPVPAGILNWMKLRVGSYYEYRQEAVVIPKGKVELLPFIDSLLDPYMVITY